MLLVKPFVNNYHKWKNHPNLLLYLDEGWKRGQDLPIGWPLGEAVSRSFHYICTFLRWKRYNHWFFKRTTQFFTINFESFYLSGRIQAILITPSHVWRQQKQMSWEADQNKCQNSITKNSIYLRKRGFVFTSLKLNCNSKLMVKLYCVNACQKKVGHVCIWHNTHVDYGQRSF